MQLFVDDAAQPLASPAPHDRVLGPGGVRVRVRIAGDEELVQAAIGLQRYAGTDEPGFPPAEVSTDQPGNALSGVAWVKADWGSARVLRRFTLTFASATGLRVRVQIARGKSSWFSPPGPHTFDVPDSDGGSDGGSDAAVTLHGSFPDTVADRVMFEILHDTSDETSGTPATATLQEPPALAFGSHARDLALRVAGGRDFFTHAGALPAAGIEVTDLLDTLREAAGGTLTDAEIELELRAGVTGLAALTWSFAAHRIVRAFAADGSDTRRLALAWDQAVVEPLLAAEDGQAPFQPASLALALASEPVRERIVLAPAGEASSLGQAVAGLGRPLHDNAQAFSLALDRPLVGVDLWARPLSERVALRVAVHADDGGRPAPEPIQASEQAAAGTRVIEGVVAGPEALPAGPAWPMWPRWPRWIDVPLDAPVQPSPTGSPWWLVVQVEEGELLWFLDGARPAGAGAMCHRRNQGAWLALDAGLADGWALTRLRVRDPEPPPPAEAHLLLAAPHDGGDDDDSVTEIPLAAGADGMLRWTAGADAPAAVTRMDLRLRAPVAGPVTLSNLRLTYREGDAP